MNSEVVTTGRIFPEALSGESLHITVESRAWFAPLPYLTDPTVEDIIRATPWTMPLPGQEKQTFRVTARFVGGEAFGLISVSHDNPVLCGVRASETVHPRLSGLSSDQAESLDRIFASLRDLLVERNMQHVPLVRNLTSHIRWIASNAVRHDTSDEKPLPPRRVRDAYDELDRLLTDFEKTLP